MKLLTWLSGKKTYLTLWIPVVLALVALVGVELDPSLLEALAKHGIVASKPAGWVTWVALAVRAADQTFMRLGVSKAEKAAGLQTPTN